MRAGGVLAIATAVAVAGLLALATCGGPSDPAGPAKPGPSAPLAVTPIAPAPQPAAARSSVPLPTFVDVAKEAGLVEMNHSGKPLQKDWIVSGMGGGSMWFDYDMDGWMDLLVVDGTMLTEQGDLQFDPAWRTRLYHNDGGRNFTDVTEKSGIDIKAFGFGGATCDYDADGWPDFFVCCWRGNFLMRNRGDGTFEDVTDKSGLRGPPMDMSTACCWGDVNGDGIADLYVANYLDQQSVIDDYRKRGIPGRSAKWRNNNVYVGPPGLPPQIDRLYFGKGDGTFREVTTTNLGEQLPNGFGFQAVMSDLDNDGDLDIYVANDTTANYLWINDGHGRFVNRALEAAVASDFDSKDQASMGVDVADINRDGFLDIVVTNFSHDHLTLYVNQTGKTRQVSFKDLSNAYNVTRPTYLRLQWGTRMFDYDNDGELDVFVACGHVYGEIDNFQKTTGSTYKQRNLLLHNVGPPTYALEDVTEPPAGSTKSPAGPAFDTMRVWRGAAFADFDNDGDMDVFVSALNDYPALFRNEGGDRRNFLVFRLAGKAPLADPSGARVTVWLEDGKPRVEELHHGASFCCDNDPRLFFGTGDAKSAKRVEVRWPNGEKQEFRDVETRKFWLVEQGKPGLAEDKR